MDSSERAATAALNGASQQPIWDATYQFVDRRAAIEQTKGMLMFVYGIDADGAFDLLRCHSQQHNAKLSAVAKQISDDLIELSQSKGPIRQV